MQVAVPLLSSRPVKMGPRTSLWANDTFKCVGTGAGALKHPFKWLIGKNTHSMGEGNWKDALVTRRAANITSPGRRGLDKLARRSARPHEITVWL